MRRRVDAVGTKDPAGIFGGQGSCSRGLVRFHLTRIAHLTMGFDARQARADRRDTMMAKRLQARDLQRSRRPIEKVNLETLRPLAKLVSPDAPTRKKDIVPFLIQAMTQ